MYVDAVHSTNFLGCNVSFLLIIDLESLILGVMVAIIPMPWKVFFPSKVLTLWSMLSAAYCINCQGKSPGISNFVLIAALRS